MEEAEEGENYATINLNDDEENLRLITALAQPSLGGPEHVEGLLDQQDHKGVGVDLALSTEERMEADNGVYDQQGHEGVGDEVVKQGQGQDVVGVDIAESEHAGNEEEIPISLDSSLENVFGPGATLLAKELENNSDKRGEQKKSDTELNTDSEVEHRDASTPSKDQRKKRGRKNIIVRDEGEHSEETVKELKKPRLGKSSETWENEGNIAENKTDFSETLPEEIVG